MSAGAEAELRRLLDIMAALRDPAHGCPWDREQDFDSIAPYTIEEAYEVADAIARRDFAALPDELGDLLFQVVYHARMAEEDGRFAFADVARAIADKMVRRHPHVFGEKRAKDAAEVLKNWEQLKKEERRAAKENGDQAKKAESLMDGVSKALPATLEGFQLTRRAARIGFDWEDVEGVLAKMKEEAEEVRRELAGGHKQRVEKGKKAQHRDTEDTERSGEKSADKSGRVEEEVGDLLFAAVNLARWLEIDPEIALKKANAKFAKRFRAMEELAAKTGRALADVPREEMEALWEKAKEGEREEPGGQSEAGGAGSAGGASHSPTGAARPGIGRAGARR